MNELIVGGILLVVIIGVVVFVILRRNNSTIPAAEPPCVDKDGNPCSAPSDWDAVQYKANYLSEFANMSESDLLRHWCKYGQYEGRSYKKPNEVLKDITLFRRLSECDNPKSCYFAIGKINKVLHFGTYGYQNHDHSSELYKYPHEKVLNLTSESAFKLLYHPRSGCTFLSLEYEKGGKPNADDGVILKWDGSSWKESYRHPRWDLITEMHVHTDGYLYATGCKYDNPSDPAGIVRTPDGVNWETWYENPNEYRFWGMCSQGNDLIIAATSSGTDWGTNNCNPCIFISKNLYWRDSSRQNEGFWGACSFKGQAFVGGSGRARVVRVSDKVTVLDKPDFEVCHSIVVDEATNTMFAFFCKPANQASGAEIWATKDGWNWYRVGNPLSCPGAYFAIYDSDTKKIFVAGGKWSQGDDGYGHIYESARV